MHTKTHTLIEYCQYSLAYLAFLLSGWGACGGPNDGFHCFYHSLRRSAMRMRVGMGDCPELRKSLLDLSIAVDGNFRFEFLCYIEELFSVFFLGL